MTVIYFSFAAVFSASLRQQILSNLFSILRPVVWLCLSYYVFAFGALTLLGIRKSVRPVKIE